ncbi:hypothetical protein AB4K20DRAFT_1870283 [Rhizopus microsporus]
MSLKNEKSAHFYDKMKYSMNFQLYVDTRKEAYDDSLSDEYFESSFVVYRTSVPKAIKITNIPRITAYEIRKKAWNQSDETVSPPQAVLKGNQDNLARNTKLGEKYTFYLINIYSLTKRCAFFHWQK